MSVLIDIHTHHFNTLNTNEKNISIINLDLENPPPIDQSEETFFSLGLHPWKAAEIYQNLKSFDFIRLENLLKSQLNNERIIFIGETGLDRFWKEKIPLEVQLKIFFLHLQIAKEKKKPLIIHCVRCFNEIIQTLKKNRFSLPIIFHDFNGNKDIVKQLANLNCFFSYGDKLFKPRSSGFKTLRSIPPSQLLLETDDSGKTIDIIYRKAAQVIDIKFDDLKKQIYENYLSLF